MLAGVMLPPPPFPFDFVVVKASFVIVLSGMLKSSGGTEGVPTKALAMPFFCVVCVAVVIGSVLGEKAYTLPGFSTTDFFVPLAPKPITSLGSVRVNICGAGDSCPAKRLKKNSDASCAKSLGFS